LMAASSAAVSSAPTCRRQKRSEASATPRMAPEEARGGT
jgi:hypothetical protein